ncbi:metabotropic glutamate receptor 8 isoform X1 [Hydra vulgaris]|uniref:metabotropic glutamate receptor 8 isoform X1 n=1 Tax=Hydra vulgaris TaxID=6087 RepID=UPI001F5E74D4|nr:metabotropic glutamate receptor 8 [Hydra vulgaris]
MISIVLLVIIISFTTASENEAFLMDGDVMIGGLVSIRDSGGINKQMCESDISTLGIIRLEAMRYAVKKVNSNSKLLPGLKLGIEVRDSCGIETRALDESLQFITTRGSETCEFKENKGKNFFGVVGDAISLTTMASATLLRLFKVPLITYGATSTELSDPNKYSFLLRTVPQDSLQAYAMVDFIEQLNWTSVFGLYSMGTYGKYGFAEFLKMSKNSSFCVASQKEIPTTASEDDIKKIIEEFNQTQRNITGIICYCDYQDTKKILQAIEKANLTTHYQLIASDASYPIKTKNAIIFSPHYNFSNVEDFYNNLNYSLLHGISNQSHNLLLRDKSTWETNPWYKQVWEQAGFLYKENNNESFKYNLSSFLNVAYQRDDKIPYVMDAVYAYAQAIHDYILNVYNGNISEYKMHKNNSEVNRTLFFSILKNVRFNGTSGIITFPVNGHYDITYNSDEVFKRIGEWRYLNESGNTSSNRLTIFKQNISIFYKNSSCQESCNKSVGQKRRCSQDDCCWKCHTCNNNEYLETLNAYDRCKDRCKLCPVGFIPNSTRNGCSQKKISVAWIIVIILLSLIGFSLNIVTIVTFLKNNSTPLVRASGREMSYLLLASIFSIYIISFIMISLERKLVCNTRIGLDIFFCVCYSSLLIKTNRIARIFSGRQDVSFLTPQWQVIILSLLVFPQICVSIFELLRSRKINDGQVTKINTHFVQENECHKEREEFFISISYNILIICLTTIYAFRTRKVPSFLNEARDIGFVMYTTILVRIVFLPVFFGASAEFKTIAIMLDTICLATTLIVGIFARKVYIILFRPEKNVALKSSTLLSQMTDTVGTVDT